MERLLLSKQKEKRDKRNPWSKGSKQAKKKWVKRNFCTKERNQGQSYRKSSCQKRVNCKLSVKFKPIKGRWQIISVIRTKTKRLLTFWKSKLKEAVISTNWMTTNTLKIKRQAWHKYKCPYKQGSFLKTRKRKSLLKIPYGEENHWGNKFQIQRKIKFKKRNQINLKNSNMAKPQTQSIKASSTLKPLKLPPQCGYSKLFVMNTSHISVNQW